MSKIMHYLRNKRFAKRQRYFAKHYLQNNDLTLISSNCLGGLIYHDAKQQFISPTIDMTYSPEDFLYLVEHFDELENTELTIVKSDKNWPVANLLFKKENKSIVIEFVHYHAFEEAKDAFYRRVRRITNNRVVLFTQKHLSYEIAKRFNDLPYKKLCIYGDYEPKCEDIFNKVNDETVFTKCNTYLTSKRDILSFRYVLGRKFILDIGLDFDYYSFLFFRK